MTATFLIGGGRDPDGARDVHAPFLREVGAGPVLCLLNDEPDMDDSRWAGYLEGTEVRLRRFRADRPPAAADFEGIAAVYVAGGLTPAYREALSPLAGLMADLPYAGYSAGAAIAAEHAIVGGWQIAGRQVCDADASEGEDEVRPLPGLGRVAFAVDVHASQWGTLSRAVSAVAAGLVAEALAIDEHTCVELRNAEIAAVHGTGTAYRIRGDRIEVLGA